MPFKKLDIFNSEQSYKAELKKELKKLDASLSEFHYYDQVALNGAPQTILVVGEIAAPLLKELKAKAKTHAVGRCFVEDGTLKLSPVKGKILEKNLKPVMKGTQFAYKIVDTDVDAGGADSADGKFEKRLQAVVSRFDKIKGKITDEERKELRILFGQIEEQKDSAVDKAAAILSKLNTRMEELIGLIGGGSEASREEVNAKTRLKATTARFDKVKGKIMDDERKALRQHFAAVVEHFQKGEWADGQKRLEQLDKEMVGYVKEALASEEQSAEKRSSDFDKSEAGQAAKVLASRIKSEAEKLKKLEAAVTREAGVLKDLQDTLSGLTKPKDIASKQRQVDASSDRLDKARQVLETSRSELLENIEKMKSEKLEKEKAFVTALGNIKSRISALDEMLDSVPVDQARAQIEALIKKQAEAQAWQEERLKAEEGGEGHGTGRHGAQTGMERQAMRASTQDGVTPDQDGNTSGVSRQEKGVTQTETWNQVKVTYTEEDGKRVIADIDKTAQNIVNKFDRTQYSGGKGSMWATPVLEKEAVEAALDVANKLKDFTHWAEGNTSDHTAVTTEFKNLTVLLGKPSSSVGWGYAVERDGDAVDVSTVKSELKKFETGAQTMDQLFKALNVKFIERDGGVKMIPHCRVVLERSAGGGAWKLKTHYPDDSISSGQLGWETRRNQPKGDITFRKGTDLTVKKNNAAP